MRIRTILLALLIFGLLSAPSFAKTFTVGEFALKYANSINMKVSSEADAMKALIEKDLIGRDVNADLPLTEEILADILLRAGINASTTDPASPLNETAVDSAISSLSGSLNANSSNSSSSQTRNGEDDEVNNMGKKTRPKGQLPNSNANPNAFFSNRDDEG
jgi:hypothetical protein